MIKRTVILSVVAGVVSLFPVVSMGAEQDHNQVQTQMQHQEQIYGSQLMSPEEMAEHQAKMRSLKTNEEREAYRLEHHKMMQERAREQGVTLPDEPPTPGGGMGSGSGMGMGSGGMGSGGMGSGGGRNR
ncbi:MAG: hypothetical protein KKC76_05395 [Proteobacteria bacterium]|nr:hypothetical protein [Pseudomonadota bacterium]MBU4295766.1 hypothetical protein [Pseudomonadota bacterium]MCG2749073.1 hypothetical protein [Desulfobulbaceae bacterium]